MTAKKNEDNSWRAIELGDRAKDAITGFEGIVVARAEWLNGCDRFIIQPEQLKDGKLIDSLWFDGPQLRLVKKGVIKPTTVTLPTEPDKPVLRKTGGPRNEPEATKEPSRR